MNATRKGDVKLRVRALKQLVKYAQATKEFQVQDLAFDLRIPPAEKARRNALAGYVSRLNDAGVIAHDGTKRSDRLYLVCDIVALSNMLEKLTAVKATRNGNGKASIEERFAKLEELVYRVAAAAGVKLSVLQPVEEVES